MGSGGSNPIALSPQPPLVLSLSKDAQKTVAATAGRALPNVPFNKLRTGFDRLRTSGSGLGSSTSGLALEAVAVKRWVRKLHDRLLRGRTLQSFDTLTGREVLALAISNEEEGGRIHADFAAWLREHCPHSAGLHDGHPPHDSRTISSVASRPDPLTGSASRMPATSWRPASDVFCRIVVSAGVLSLLNSMSS